MGKHAFLSCQRVDNSPLSNIHLSGFVAYTHDVSTSSERYACLVISQLALVSQLAINGIDSKRAVLCTNDSYTAIYKLYLYIFACTNTINACWVWIKAYIVGYLVEIRQTAVSHQTNKIVSNPCQLQCSYTILNRELIAFQLLALWFTVNYSDIANKPTVVRCLNINLSLRNSVYLAIDALHVKRFLKVVRVLTINTLAITVYSYRHC